MINLSIDNAVVKIETPYDEKAIEKIKKCPGRRWDFVNKFWTIPMTSVMNLYSYFPESEISASPDIMKYICSQDGKDFVYMRRIVPDVVEISFTYHHDIMEAINQLTYKHRVDITVYTVTDDEVKKLMKILGNERCKILNTISPYTELYSTGKEYLNLDYTEPCVTFKCSNDYGTFLTKQIPLITKDYKNWCYKMPLNAVAELIGLVGLKKVNISSYVSDRLNTYRQYDAPVKERLKNYQPTLTYNMKNSLLPHQMEAFVFGTQHNRMLLADSPGLGKTITSIAIAAYRLRKETALLRNCLIVCGVNSVKYNWMAEIEKHSNEKGMLFQGTLQKKLKLIDEWYNDPDTLFGIINIESLRNKEILAKLNEMTSMVIVDEIHKAKNGESKQGKALRNLTAPGIRIGLSGTPMTNKPEDLWNILSWLGIEPKSFPAFKRMYCVYGGYQNREIVNHKNLDKLSMLLKEVMLRRKKEDVIDLPPKIYKDEYVELTAEQTREYKEAREGILKVWDQILQTNNPLTSLLRLRQITSGLFTEPKQNAKMNRIKEILTESIIPEGSKAILFTSYEEIASCYREAFKEYNPAYIVGKVSVENRQKEVNRFQNDPECKIAIGTIGAMGTGLTMTAASYVFFIDKDWAQTNNEQAEDRAHRIGTTDSVTVISMVAKDTIDERIENILDRKADMFENIVDGKALQKVDMEKMMSDLIGLSTLP